MNHKTTVNIQNKVSDTLFIPLYMRAKLTKDNSSIIVDNSAVELCERLDYDFSKYDKADMSLIGCGVRADFFDRLCVKQILQSQKNNRKPVVVCIGCGLDNRLARVKNHLQHHFQDKQSQTQSLSIDWYEMDLPEVIELRRELLPIDRTKDKESYSLHHQYIEDSLLENDWLEKVLSTSLINDVDIDLIFIIEGVLMYFEESVVQDFFLRVADLTNKAFNKKNLTKENRPDMIFGFDTTAAFGVKNSRKHDAMKHTDADVTFKWAVEDDHVLHKWHKGYQLQSRENIMELHKKEWSLLGKLIRLVPTFRNNSRILVYQLESVEDSY